ncbi:uncharacterized protein [Venturia canescens]|uniref:uncharacterized protein n=1 Tax=Venturia canescens TaxID=32260 RepID=UPI001C9C0ACE|nr:uncharacterized protein LOC122409253 [Venturia canescens]
MSQSGSGGSNGPQTQAQDQDQRSGEQKNDSVLRSDGQTSQILCQNGRAEAGTTAVDNLKPDISNGFENRTIEYERFGVHDRNQSTVGVFEQAPQTRAPLQYPATFSDLPPEYTATSQQTIQYPTLRRPSTTGQLEDRHPIIAQLPPQQYQTEKAPSDRVQHVSQTSTQTLPVQAQPHFVTEYVSDQVPQYTQIRAGQFEVRSQIYSQQQQPQQQLREYGDRAGYVTRDVTYREQAGASLYGHPQSTGNPVFSGTGPYVTVQHAGSQLPSQSTSPQPPYYTGVVLPSQPPPGYGQFTTGQPQYPYSQYPQTVMNPIPYTPHGSIYQPQQFSQQSPNPQRFSQDLSQYQAQPIIQPIAQNVMTATEKPGGRGPKPMVPPRGNSKITHGDPNIRKQATVEVPGQKAAAALPPKYEAPITQNPQVSQEQVIRGEATLLIAGTQVGPDGQERRFLSPINQNPRTRQDGLYVDLNGEQVPRDNAPESIASECGFYVSRSEHRKSVSVDVTTSFQRRNDTITFTFPGDNGQHDTIASHKTASLGERKRPESTQVFPIEARRVDPVLRVPPMTFDQRQENRKSIVPERKPEWGNVSPNQRPGTMSAQENRRSDYFEEHRRSPMNLEAKRMEDVRRSPMPFVSIRDSSNDRATQKSPSFGNQNFEKTRQELAMWAEQRQRQDLERGMFPNQMFSTSPRSRNPSEERRESRMISSAEDSRKDPRLPPAVFQPISNITQSSIMEQRRHLRHVSADLTKHMEFSRKDFDDQPITGSVANLVPVLSNTISSQRASPNLCHQYPALSEAKLDSKTLQLTVVTDFVSDNHTPKSGGESSDHIIHSHRKSHNASTNLLTHSKSQAENLQSQAESHNEKIDSLQAQQQQQQQQNQHMQNQQMQNQQSLDMISEKLSQFERQQSDLQAKLQCLQNQNQILDKVAMFQHQADLHVRFQCLQERQGEKCMRQSTDYQPKNLVAEMQQMKLSPLPDHLLEAANDKATNAQDQPIQQASHRQSLFPVPTYISAQSLQSQACQSLTCERLSPRLPLVDSADQTTSVVGQIAMASNAEFERSECTRSSLQYRLTCPSDVPENVPVVASTSVTANTSTISGSSNMTGTLKKVPPEKPPRTSLIVLSPEIESNRSQPAIGLKQTPKARPTIFGTVASDLNPKDGNSRRSLPQTPAGGVGGKGLGGAGSASGMVNGASSDHQDIRDASAINPEHALVYRDGNLVSGSLEALVQHMVPTEEYYPDRAYLFAFLLSARLFIKPHELLGDVCALCEHQQNLNGEGGKERLHRFVPRLVQLLAEWTETFPYDFRDERVMGHVRSITQKVAAVDAAARQEVSALLQNLLLRLTALERYEEGLARLSTEAATDQLTQVDVTELCPSATVLAQQLTHVELERLSYIGPEEFVQAFAKESPHLETSFKDMKKTRNLESYVQWFNRLSYFVATEVCKHAKKKQRVRVVEYWIEAARECFNIGNFNSLMAIIAGLNMSPISRLKKTWSKVQSAKFSILEHQMDPSSNFSSYRSTLKAAMWRSAGATDERQRIVVPFFSLLVKDLYFLNEGCSNKLPNGHINFEKFWQLAKQVTEFIAWKQVACPFEKNSRVIAFLQASPVLTENALALASFECEPPDNNPEKERYKALKSELNAQ